MQVDILIGLKNLYKGLYSGEFTSHSDFQKLTIALTMLIIRIERDSECSTYWHDEILAVNGPNADYITRGNIESNLDNISKAVAAYIVTSQQLDGLSILPSNYLSDYVYVEYLNDCELFLDESDTYKGIAKILLNCTHDEKIYKLPEFIFFTEHHKATGIAEEYNEETNVQVSSFKEYISSTKESKLLTDNVHNQS